jgi:hypothetical protein
MQACCRRYSGSPPDTQRKRPVFVQAAITRIAVHPGWASSPSFAKRTGLSLWKSMAMNARTSGRLAALGARILSGTADELRPAAAQLGPSLGLR